MENQKETFILGMYVLCLILGPVILSASTTCAPSLVTISLVPLHNPSAWSKFRNSIMGIRIYRSFHIRAYPNNIGVKSFPHGLKF